VFTIFEEMLSLYGFSLNMKKIVNKIEFDLLTDERLLKEA
jgi:hypothetical protein